MLLVTFSVTELEKCKIQLPDVGVAIKQSGPVGLSFQTACVEGFTMGRVEGSTWKVWQNVPTFPLPTVGVQPAYLSEEAVTQRSAGEDKTHGNHTIMLDDYSSWTYVCAVKNTDRDFPVVGYSMSYVSDL